MMDKLLIRPLSRVLWDSDLLATRWTLGIAELFWAMILLWEGNLFARPVYHKMELVASSNVWGYAFLATGLTQLAVMMWADLHGRVARWFACFNACLWVTTSWAMATAVYPPPGIGGELALALAATWVWIRPYLLAEAHRHAHKTHS